MIRTIEHTIEISYLPEDCPGPMGPPDQIDLLDKKLNEIEQSGGRILALNLLSQSESYQRSTTTYLITFRLPPAHPYRDYPHGEIEHDDA